jgi:hypothetical protein
MPPLAHLHGRNQYAPSDREQYEGATPNGQEGRRPGRFLNSCSVEPVARPNRRTAPSLHLTVVPRQVVRRFRESGGGREIVQCGVRAVEIVVVKIEREEGSAMVTGVVRASVSPLAGESLNEAFGLAIGLGPVRTGEAMLEAELMTGLGEELGAISGAAVSEDALDADAMSLVKVDGLVESGQNTGSFFIREEGGKSQAGMIIDGHVEGLDAGTGIAVGAIAGGADAGLEETAKLFNIKMKELARSGALVAERRRPGRVEGGEAVETMAAQDAGEGGLGNGKNHEDLSVGAALTAEG